MAEQRPPTYGNRSITCTCNPPRARSSAAARPPGPAPMISTLLGRLGERQREDAGASAGASEIMRSSGDSSYEPAYVAPGSRAINSMVIAKRGRIPPQEDKAV